MVAVLSLKSSLHLPAGVADVTEVVELAKEAGLNEKALEADLTSTAADIIAGVAKACRWESHGLVTLNTAWTLESLF